MGDVKQEDQSAQDSQFSTEHDYIARATPTVAQAATEGDRAAAEDYHSSPFHLSPASFDAGYATAMAAEFREGQRKYLAGKGNKADEVFRDFGVQAKGYESDAWNIQQANQYYSTLVPIANVAVDSVVRFKAIESSVGVTPFDMDRPDRSSSQFARDGGTHLQDRSNSSAEAMRETKGVVSDAARTLVDQHSSLSTALQGVYAAAQRARSRALAAERTAAQTQKQRLEERIAACTSILGVIDKMLGWSSQASTTHFSVETNAAMKEQHIIEDPTGGKAAGRGFNTAAAVGGVVQGAVGLGLRVFHDTELSVLEAKIGSLNEEITDSSHNADVADDRAAVSTFKDALSAYRSAATHFENAVASRRTQYINAGAQADLAQHHGRIGKGEDKVSQTMLLISSARETRLILDKALEIYSPGHDLKKPTPLLDAARGFAHRARGYATSAVVTQPGERQPQPDQVAIKNAYNLSAKWADATKTELDAFDRVEAQSRAMLMDVGKISGEY